MSTANLSTDPDTELYIDLENSSIFINLDNSVDIHIGFKKYYLKVVLFIDTIETESGISSIKDVPYLPTTITEFPGGSGSKIEFNETVRFKDLSIAKIKEFGFAEHI